MPLLDFGILAHIHKIQEFCVLAQKLFVDLSEILYAGFLSYQALVCTNGFDKFWFLNFYAVIRLKKFAVLPQNS